MNNQVASTAHLNAVINGLLEGQIVPFFGAGVNLCGPKVNWVPKTNARLPSGDELTDYLAKRFSYPGTAQDLARVSQFADTLEGRGPLFEELHAIFDLSFSPTPLHDFFAQLPQLLRTHGYPKTKDQAKRRLTIVTTNYDDVMECALEKAGENFHVISYVSEFEKNQNLAPFMHRPPGAKPRPIRGNAYADLNNDEHPVVLKIHGAVERLKDLQQNPEQDSYEEPNDDSFVITEDHYIDYLSKGDVAESIPAILKTQLRRSGFLFLGYALRDWNLRAFLRRIWREQNGRNYQSWAVVKDCSDFEQLYWSKNNVGMVEADLGEYVDELSRSLQARL